MKFAVRRRFSTNFKISYGNNNLEGIQSINLIDVDQKSRSMRILDCGSGSKFPPLVIIGGTAQTINTFTPHIKQLSKYRRLIIPEMRCQGQTELLSTNSTTSQHVDDFLQLMKTLDISQIDLAGFSFGGRIGLSVAAYHPQLVRRLSLTGVPLIRNPLGKSILMSWKEGLRDNQFRQCAWSFVLNGYSESFLENNHQRLPEFVEMILKGNDPTKLFNLISSSHIDNEDDPFSISVCAPRIQCPTQVISSNQDRISSAPTVKALASKIQNSIYHEVPNSGHLLPFESPVVWRKMLVDFFDS